MSVRRFARRIAVAGAVVAAGIGFLAPPAGVAAKKGEKAADWPEITEAERKLTAVPDDPDADAVILRNTRDGSVVTDGRWAVNELAYHWRLKVLNERGKRYAEVEIPSWRKYSQVRGVQARTIKADATVVPVPPDQIFEKVLRQIGSLKVTAFVFQFPAVEPGAILEYRYTRQDRNFVYLDPWFFAGPEFTLFSRMSQVVPEVAHYTMLCDKCPNPEPTRSDYKAGKLKGRRFTLEQRDVLPYREEHLMPPPRDVIPRAEMSLKSWTWQSWEALKRTDTLFTDWSSVAQYAGYYYARAYLIDQVLVKKAVDEWVRGLADPAERVKAIYRHVQQDFQYVPYDDVWGSTDSIADIFKERAADNEEKAVLLVAALRTQGLDPRIALVSGRHKGALYSTFHSLSFFSHAIVGLPQQDGTMLWLDPTVTYAPFGFMPWQDSGAGALLATGEAGKLFALPLKEEPGGERYRVILRPRPDGTSGLEVEAEFTGEDAIDMRDDLAPVAEAARLSSLQAWVAGRRPGASLRAHAIENVDDPDRPLKIKMTIDAPGLVTVAEDMLLVRACALTCEEGNPISRQRRAYPFYADRGRNTEEIVSIVPPDGMRAGTPPAPVAVRSSFANLTLQCAPGDAGVQCTRRFTVPRNRYPASMQDEIRAFYERTVAADRTVVPVQAAPSGAATVGR
jgi:hypothetical protein